MCCRDKFEKVSQDDEPQGYGWVIMGKGIWGCNWMDWKIGNGYIGKKLWWNQIIQDHMLESKG